MSQALLSVFYVRLNGSLCLGEFFIRRGRAFIKNCAYIWMYCWEKPPHLHDIGKIGIQDSVLRKKDRLTVEEIAVRLRVKSF